MKEIKFKTNINCGNCIKSVTPYLNQVESVETWSVDTDSPNKVLTVEMEEEGHIIDVIRAVREAGYEIEETV